MTDAVSNVDFLAWFSDDERGVCGSCKEKACVTLPEAEASFCLACGAITLHGVRIDVDRRLTV
jgi:NMD protein affecting ribosome stability and mRNA decay